MSSRAKELSKQIEAFRDDVIAFVEQLSGDDWNAVSEWEQWTVGVTALHLGVAHLGIFKLLGMIVQGQTLPQWTMDQINEMSKKDAREHADCTKAEALEQLRNNGTEITAFVAGLSDDELDRKGSMPAFGGAASVSQVIDAIIFQSAQQHFKGMKAAVGR
jgi:uncharacterized damage-inducible protein DinB